MNSRVVFAIRIPFAGVGLGHDCAVSGLRSSRRLYRSARVHLEGLRYSDPGYHADQHRWLPFQQELVSPNRDSVGRVPRSAAHAMAGQRPPASGKTFVVHHVVRIKRALARLGRVTLGPVSWGDDMHL